MGNGRTQLILNTWKSVYDHLLLNLAQLGKNDACGNGDFWLVDDDWGEGQQKICIFNHRILTRSFISRLQGFLKNIGSQAEILIQLEVQGVAPEGIRVTQAAVREDWNLKELRNVFGEDFCR